MPNSDETHCIGDGTKITNSAATDAGGFAAVCAVLWVERDLLQALTRTVVVGRLAGAPSAAGAVLTPRRASAGQRATLERVQLQEVLRAVVVDAAVAPLTGPMTLAELAARAPEPWSTMLLDHRSALCGLAAELDSLGVLRQLSLSEFLA
jgi:hypothetical protein